MVNPIFTVSGLRGIVGHDLFPEVVTKYSFGFAKFLKAKKIAIGRDTRVSGPMLFHSAVAGLFSAGCDVYDFGVCPTPAIIMMVKKLGLDGGVQITASHNPKEYNGIKFISNNGTFLFEDEIDKFKKYLRKNYRSEAKALFYNSHLSLTNVKIIEPYLKQIINSKYFRKISNKNFKVGIDSCNGTAEEYAIKLVEMLGATPVTIKRNNVIFPRPPEPKPENLKQLSLEVRKRKLDLGIAFDPDADRFTCIDELGVPLSEEASVLLAIQFILEQKKGPVVVNNSTTMAVDDICQRFRVPLYRSKVGEANVVKKMREVDAIVGGEGNGGVVVPEINSARDGMVATAILLKLLSKRNCPLSVIRDELPKYYIIKTTLTNYKKEWQKIIRKKFQNDVSVRFDTQDGLKVQGKDYWILLRASRTEPVLRIISESKSKNLTPKLINETIKLLKLKP